MGHIQLDRSGEPLKRWSSKSDEILKTFEGAGRGKKPEIQQALIDAGEPARTTSSISRRLSLLDVYLSNKTKFKKWTEAEDNYLKSLKQTDTPISTIQKYLKEEFDSDRTEGAIRSRLGADGLGISVFIDKIYPGFRNGALTVIEDTGETTNDEHPAKLWLCRCDCGKEKKISSILLIHTVKGKDRSVKSCGCQIYCRAQDDVIGETFQQIKVLKFLRSERVGRKSKKKVKRKDFHFVHMFECECLACGNIIEEPLTRLHEGRRNQTCGCLNRVRGSDNPLSKNYKDIPRRFIGTIQKNALDKGRAYDLSDEYLWEVWEKQGGREGGVPARCALSGEPIYFSSNISTPTHDDGTTASGDRVDSLLDYIEGNFQWVHKDWNASKMNQPNEKFCERVLHAGIYRAKLQGYTITEPQKNECELNLTPN